jgi:hypothetical protein
MPSGHGAAPANQEEFMIDTDSITKSAEADVTPYKGLYLRGKELADFMSKHKDTLFYGRTYSGNTISSFATRCIIPSKLTYLEGKDAVKKIEKRLQTYDVAEIIRWCRLGADRDACVQVLKERK